MPVAMQLVPTFSMTALEGLKRALGADLTPALQARLAALGVDFGKPLLAAYPQPIWDQALIAIVEAVYPALPREQAFFTVGKRFMLGFASTLVGKAVVELGRLVGPERTIKRMQHNQRSTNNYSSVTLEKVGPAHFRIRGGVLPEYLPAFRPTPGMGYAPMVAGIYFGVLTLLELKQPQVTFHDLDDSLGAAVYELTWG